jgi:hypothetical protein
VSEPLEVAATWLPAATGPHCWLDFRPVAAAADLAAMRRAGITTARVHLAWDAFVPSHRQVNRHRLRDLDALLEAARELDMACVLVLFAQSFGDGLLLPRYAVDRARPRRAVRVVTEGGVVTGGPRDQWADPLMLEVEAMWLETLLGSFANHPAIAAWDLGHDPATTLRPRRISHLTAWAELLGGMVRARGDRCRLTFGAADVLSARGTRLAAVTAHVDELGLVLEPQRVGLGAAPGEADLLGATFTLELAMRLASDGERIPPLHAVTGFAAGEPADLEALEDAAEHEPTVGAPVAIAWDVPLVDPPAAQRAAGELVGRFGDAGAAGMSATAWTTLSDRVATSAPLDHHPSFARHGLALPGGELRAVGEPWAALARSDRAAGTAAPWPDRLDAEAYYSALPDSARDLFTAWRTERGERAGEPA